MFWFFCLFLKAVNQPTVPADFLFFFCFFWHTMKRHKSAELIKAPFESLVHLNSVPSPPPPHLLKCSLSRLHLPSFSARSPARRSATPISLLALTPPHHHPHIRSPGLYFKDDEAIVLQTPLKAKCAIRRGGGGERASGERRGWG